MTTIKPWQDRPIAPDGYMMAYRVAHIRAMADEIDELRAENAKLRKLLEDCQYALDYASDMTKPEGLSGCDCPICTTTIALHKELRKKS